MDHRQTPSMTQGQLPSRGLQLFQMQGTKLLASPGKSFLPFLSLAVTSSSRKPKVILLPPSLPHHYWSSRPTSGNWAPVSLGRPILS